MYKINNMVTKKVLDMTSKLHSDIQQPIYKCTYSMRIRWEEGTTLTSKLITFITTIITHRNTSDIMLIV